MRRITKRSPETRPSGGFTKRSAGIGSVPVLRSTKRSVGIGCVPVFYASNRTHLVETKHRFMEVLGAVGFARAGVDVPAGCPIAKRSLGIGCVPILGS